jgi:hypothetical protein
VTALTLAERRALSDLRAELARLARYDDESIVNDIWVRQRYDCGCYPTLAPARKAAVRTAWHEAGHAVAALAIGARFSSASIHHGHGSEGRVHGVSAEADQSFVVDAAGQLAERLMDWSMLEADTDLSAFLATWRRDGGDARRFRRSAVARFGADEAAAWRYSEELLTPLRPQVRQLARALLVHPRHLRYNVAAALAASS